ncbi:unnamed protein product [Adineta ricciae]|uniref:Cadherin domain-containing protein n=1 Tax=Adineta ricciae TaxID=249248 RepID=A0A815C5K5_ADIRI|nr:unnamed protein product [Adineta ricciae]CAF1276010.1 unnamed protein product [Adineta ricciae]
MFVLISFLLLVSSTSSHTIFKYTIEEKSPLGTIVTDFSQELRLNTSAFFRIYELLPFNENFFAVDNQTGQLKVRSRLDRDQMCSRQQCSCDSCEVILQLLVDIQGKSLSKLVQIKIKDLNDHSPNFPPQSIIPIIHIKENVPLGYRIVLPYANDPDEGSNSVQSYRLHGLNSDDFDIDFSSFDIPYLIVRSSLDRQRQSFYSLTLIASDHGDQSRSDSIQLDIRIVDSNDPIPTFLQTVYNVDIREDTVIGTTILNIEAISDKNEKIFYELLTESPFIIDRLTGQIQLSKALDYEREKSYRLTIKAYEQSIPTYANIFIRIIDVNDNPVSIRILVEGNTTLQHKESDKTVLFTPENTLVGTIIAHVILNDLDSFANGNPYLQLRTSEPPLPLIYKLIYQNNFQNLKLYSLILHQTLDRETKSIYDNIQFLAYDSGTPTLHTQLVISLNITDVNDCIPKLLTNSSIYQVNENNPIGYLIDRLRAYDCDLGDNARVGYRLLNQSNLLILNSQTGELSLNQSIDFEKLNRFHEKNRTTIDLDFLIELRDYGQPSLSNQTKITLRIHDMNDHSPEFDQHQSYNWTYSKEMLQPGIVLGRIIATDADSGLFGFLHYSIRSLNPCLILNITSLGYVYIPHEFPITTCSLSPSSTFEVTATDYDPINARSTTQTLIINLHSNSSPEEFLPKLLPLSLQRTTIDVHTKDHTAFIIDITTLNNRTYEPRISLNHNHLVPCWNISSSGELRLISRPSASSYFLSFDLVDDYTQNHLTYKLQIDICNSSILNSCQLFRSSNNKLVLIYAMSLALSITFLCIVIFSIIICLCCRKSQQHNDKLASMHHHSFLQYNDDYHNEKIDTASDQYKSASDSTIRDDDHDSACIVNGHSASSTTSSNDTWYNRKESTIEMQPTSVYQYDIKLAELLRKNPNPPCIYLSDLPPIPQSSSTDYGFSSLNLSKSSSTSTISNHQPEVLVERSTKMKSFISSHECVV